MRRSHWALGLCISMLALGCPGQKPIEAPSGPKVAQKEEEEKIVWRPSKSGLGFRLSQVDGDGPQKRAKEAVTTPLDDKETQALLARVAPIKDAPEDVVPFALRAKSLPPPITGETVKEPFPPPPGPPPAEVVAGPLKVERALPKGDVPIAPHLAVTFSHPMVPLTSHAELSNLPSPVKLTPTPKGEWRWLGTQTVMFQPDPRFPMATEYTVDIPAGTRAMNGKVLEKAEHFTFKTPPPSRARGAARRLSEHRGPAPLRRARSGRSIPRRSSLTCACRAGGSRPSRSASRPRPRSRRTRASPTASRRPRRGAPSRSRPTVRSRSPRATP
jgi:hypothetical protein